jgi:hypothetical protein
MTITNFEYDKWNKWSNKSKSTKFDEGNQIHGEKKLGKEFDTQPLGQNHSYDLDVGGEKWECKKIDKDGSFRLGVESQTKFGELVSLVINLFDKIKILIPNLLEGETKEELKLYESYIFEKIFKPNRTRIYYGFKKSEVSESNLGKTREIINELLKLMEYDGDEKKIELISPLGEKKNYCIEVAYELLKLSDIEDFLIQEKLGDNFNLAVIRSKLKHLEIFKKQSLKIRLDTIVRDVFLDKILVLVDNELGYKPIKNLEPLECYRLTHGGPRCKYVL